MRASRSFSLSFFFPCTVNSKTIWHRTYFNPCTRYYHQYPGWSNLASVFSFFAPIRFSSSPRYQFLLVFFLASSFPLLTIDPVPLYRTTWPTSSPVSYTPITQRCLFCWPSIFTLVRLNKLSAPSRKRWGCKFLRVGYQIINLFVLFFPFAEQLILIWRILLDHLQSRKVTTMSKLFSRRICLLIKCLLSAHWRSRVSRLVGWRARMICRCLDADGYFGERGETREFTVRVLWIGKP